MDYKEKYNKLVEAIKVLQETNPSDEGIQKWVNDNVPELKESEDEKIRTGLINGFKECLKNSQYPKNAQKYWHNIKFEDILAWLEKQKENPQVDGFDAELNALLKKYEHLSKKELQEPLEFYLGVVRDDLDVVREDKPKWSENDEHHWMMCLGCVEECATQEREDFSKTTDWLKSIKQRIMEEQQ